MARLIGVKERRDAMFYDTHTVMPGQSVRFFGATNIGDLFKTNIRFPQQFPGDQTYVLMGFGARCIGKSRDEEDQIFDHVIFRVFVGDKPYAEILGPHASMLRHVYRKDELEQMQRLVDEPPPDVRRPKRTDPIKPPTYRPAYVFIRPIVIPVRQNYGVIAEASQWLPAEVPIRVTLFGLQTRDVV